MNIAPQRASQHAYHEQPLNSGVCCRLATDSMYWNNSLTLVYYCALRMRWTVMDMNCRLRLITKKINLHLHLHLQKAASIPGGTPHVVMRPPDWFTLVCSTGSRVKSVHFLESSHVCYMEKYTNASHRQGTQTIINRHKSQTKQESTIERAAQESSRITLTSTAAVHVSSTATCRQH